MRREGRPRGMVRTFNILPEQLNPRPANRVVNKVVAPPTAGLFMKVSPKPTSHSKFTGKCERPRCSACHLHPATKSKDKSKGSYKVKSIDDKLSYKVISWTLMPDDRSDKTLVAGYSASRILDDLYQDHVSYDYDYDNDYDHDDDEVDASCVLKIDEKAIVEMEVCRDVVVMGDDIIIHGGVMPDDDDGYQGFYDISGVFSAVVDDNDEGDEGWSLVGGM